jgi:hypothetical protein
MNAKQTQCLIDQSKLSYREISQEQVLAVKQNERQYRNWTVQEKERYWGIYYGDSMIGITKDKPQELI